VRLVGSAVRLLAWALVAALGILALVVVSGSDLGSSTVIGLVGLGALPFLIPLPVAAVAFACRHIRLGAVALAVAAAAVPTGVPELAARTDLPPAAGRAPALRILSWNLFYDNTDAAAIEAVLRSADADVVVLQEVSATNLPVLGRSPILSAYAHRFTSPLPSAFGSGIWSRFPLEGAEELDIEGLPMTQAVVGTPAGPVRLINVHTRSPVAGRGRDLWPRQLRRLGEEAQRPGPPVLLAGDFNATWGHRQFRQLLDVGLADAAATRGRPWSPTWPAAGWPLPPILRLDHVLTGPGLVATSYATGPSLGSDHRSIVADLALTTAGP